jgi:hypothetical protein
VALGFLFMQQGIGRSLVAVSRCQRADGLQSGVEQMLFSSDETSGDETRMKHGRNWDETKNITAARRKDARQ